MGGREAVQIPILPPGRQVWAPAVHIFDIFMIAYIRGNLLARFGDEPNGRKRKRKIEGFHS